MGRPRILFFAMVLACAGLCAPLLSAQPLPVDKPAPASNASATENSKPTEFTEPSVFDYHAFLVREKTTKPLNTKDTELYREIFRLQAKGNFVKADTLLATIDNTLLFGHVQAQRFLHPAYNAREGDVANWLVHYADHPQAARMTKKYSQGRSTYQNRITGTLEELRYFSNGSRYISDKYKGGQRNEVNILKRQVRTLLDRGAATAALNAITQSHTKSYIDPIDKSQILAQIAASYLYHGHADKARSTALKAIESSKENPLSGWVMGLTAWIRQDFKEATTYFKMASRAHYASPWMTSAASYWGARAATRAGLYSEVSPLLAMAVKHQRTFYGLVATKALGYGYDFNWTMPDFTPRMKNSLLQYRAGARAVALAQVGQPLLAEAELFTLPVRTDSDLATAAIALAHHYNLAGYAMRFSSAMANPAGGYYDAGLFPVSTYTRQIKDHDIALLNAFIRQESRFIANAQNATGATGLMQIMPATAAFITGDEGYKTKKGIASLQNPQTNVNIGADYLNHLLDLDVVNQDLFGLTIAYNAGPGKLTRWKRDITTEDPLLFIELIPASETRAFVERVLTNYWIYQMQNGQDPYTLTAVAGGDWPVITPPAHN